MTNVRCQVMNPMLKQALIDIAQKNSFFTFGERMRGPNNENRVNDPHYTCLYIKHDKISDKIYWGLAAADSLTGTSKELKNISIEEMADVLSTFKTRLISCSILAQSLTLELSQFTLEVKLNKDKSIDILGYRISAPQFDALVAARNSLYS